MTGKTVAYWVIYMMTILGVWKVLGAIAMLAPGWLRLKERGYAGVFFNMSGAAISHAVVGDEAWRAFGVGQTRSAGAEARAS